MNPRQFLRALKHLAGDVIPWQLVDVRRGRAYDAAVLAAADQLADAEAEYEVLPEPPVEVEPHPPVAPSAGSATAAVIRDVLHEHAFWAANRLSVGTNAHCGCGHRPHGAMAWREHIAPILAQTLNK